MKKINLKKELHALFHAPLKSPELIEVPPQQYLMIDGLGDPNTAQSYVDAIEALYSVSYTLKFMIKKGKNAIDYGVPPLEGLWWTNPISDFSPQNKNAWHWTAMIMQPQFIIAAQIAEATEQALKKKPLPAAPLIRFEQFIEGRCAQIMHIGPYASEAQTITLLHDFIHAAGNKRRGKHHEIYLSDPRRTAPEKLKTIIRQPIQ
jgi:hypothetical protein